MKKLLFIILLLSTVPVKGAAVTIKFIDSVNVEEAYIQSNGAISNFSRVIEGGSAARVIHYMGRNFSNNWNTVMRFPTFKDSTDNYSGLVIDSFKIVQKLHTATYDANDDSYMFAVGIDTNMNWVEGNRNGVNAQDCEVCWDSAQTEGSGTCATKQTWLVSGARGTTDTMGIWGGTPADSVLVFTDEVANDSIILYVDTQVVNQWKDYDYANEGVVIFTRGGPNDQYFHKYYSSESNMSGSTDSINYAILYGSTPAAEAASTRRSKVIRRGQ
jgi:hypothetical protein